MGCLMEPYGVLWSPLESYGFRCVSRLFSRVSCLFSRGCVEGDEAATDTLAHDEFAVVEAAELAAPQIKKIMLSY